MVRIKNLTLQHKAEGKMLSYEEIKDKPSNLRSLIGLSNEEFEAIFEAFEKAWKEEEIERQKKEGGRRRKPGGGRKAVLEKTEDKLLFILYYYKNHPLQAVMGALFSMSQGRANEWIHLLSKVLKKTFEEGDCLPKRVPEHLKEVLTPKPRVVTPEAIKKRKQRQQKREKASLQ